LNRYYICVVGSDVRWWSRLYKNTTNSCQSATNESDLPPQRIFHAPTTFHLNQSCARTKWITTFIQPRPIASHRAYPAWRGRGRSRSRTPITPSLAFPVFTDAGDRSLRAFPPRSAVGAPGELSPQRKFRWLLVDLDACLAALVDGGLEALFLEGRPQDAQDAVPATLQRREIGHPAAVVPGMLSGLPPSLRPFRRPAGDDGVGAGKALGHGEPAEFLTCSSQARRQFRRERRRRRWCRGVGVIVTASDTSAGLSGRRVWPTFWPAALRAQ
jgi:hypothetical protein